MSLTEDPFTEEEKKKEAIEQPKKLKYGQKTEFLKQLIKETGLINHKEIKQKWKEKYPEIKPPTRSYTDFIVKGLTPEQKIPETTEKPVVSEPTPEEIKKLEEAAAKPLSDVAKGILEGKIKKEEIKAIFVIENKIWLAVIGEECFDTETMNLLAVLFEAPLNRMFVKYADKNSDLYIALGVWAFAHIPMALKVWKKRKPKVKPENVQ